MPNLGADVQRGWVSGLSVPPIRRATAVNGAGVNFTEAEGPVSAILQVGQLSNTTLSLVLSMEESTNDNTADASGAADAYAALSPAATVTVTEPGIENTSTTLTTFNRSKKYVRAVVTPTGTAGLTNNLYGVSLHSPSKSY